MLILLPSDLVVEDLVDGALLREDGEESLVVEIGTDCERLDITDVSLVEDLFSIDNSIL